MGRKFDNETCIRYDSVSNQPSTQDFDKNTLSWNYINQTYEYQHAYFNG